MTRREGTRIQAVALAATFLAAAGAAPAEDFREPKSGVSFPVDRDGMVLLGAGLRVKKIAFIKAKVYATALYVDRQAAAGPLAEHAKGATSPAFYKELVWGDFPKQVVLKFTRNVGQQKIQEAMREALEGSEKAPLDTFVSYFPEVKEGQECVLRWGKGGVLETTMAGTPKPPIDDKTFAAAVFGLYVGEKPLQEDLKADLVTRAAQVLGR